MKVVCPIILFWFCFVSLNALNNFTRVRLDKPSTSNYYLMDLYMGSPIQKISVIADTGSDSMYLKCGKCKGCQDETQVFFQPNQSNTNHPILCGSKDKDVKCQNKCTPQKQKDNCLFVQEYGAQIQATTTLKGHYRTDLMSFQALSAQVQSFNVTFGCIDQNINFNTVATGILGLGPRLQNVLTKWFEVKGTNRKKQIAICLSQKGGFCEFGQNPNRQQKASMRGKFKPNNYYYETNDLQWIKFGDVNLQWSFLSFLQVSHVIFDSGAPLMLIPYEKHFVVKFQSMKACLLNLNICLFILQYLGVSVYSIRNAGNKPINTVLNSIFPNLYITLNKVTFVTKPEEYMTQILNQDQEDKTIRFFAHGITSYSPSQRQYLLGAVWLKNRKIVYNLEQSYYQIYDNYNCSQMSQSQESITPQKPKQKKQKKTSQTNKKSEQIKKNKQQPKDTQPKSKMPQKESKQKISNDKQKQKLSNENSKQNINFDEFRDIESFIDKIKNDEQFERKTKQFAQKENPISLTQRSLLQNGSYLFLLIFLILIVFPPLFFQLFRKIKKSCFNSVQNIENDSSVSQIPNVSTQVRNQDSRNQNSQLFMRNTLTEQSQSKSQQCK